MTQNSGDARRYRAGDADRDRVVEQLRKHHADGRLTAEEFQERMESALRARYVDELPPLLDDLPPEEGRQTGPRAEAPRGQYGHPGPWSWHGHEPWQHASHGWRCRPFLPLLPLLVVFAVMGSVGAAVHGHFPWPLLWLLVAVWWFRGRALRRWLRAFRP